MHGYQEILEVFKKPGKQRHQEYKEWLGLVEGEKWNADFCSIPRRYSLFEGGV